MIQHLFQLMWKAIVSQQKYEKQKTKQKHTSDYNWLKILFTLKLLANQS